MHSKKIQLLLSILLAMTISISLLANDQIVYMRDGRTLVGEIVSQTATKIVLKLQDGTVKEIQKQEIRRVAFKGAPVKPPENKDTPPTTTAPDITEAQKKEEESKKQQLANEKAEKRKQEIEAAKRNRLEVFLGAGSGNLEYQSPGFYQNTISIGSSSSDSNGKWQYPILSNGKSGNSYTGSIRYSWNRFVGQVGGTSIRSGSNYTQIGQDSSQSTGLYPKIVSGDYQNSLKQAYANLSFSVYPHPKHDIRPVIGIQRFWIKTEDANPFAIIPSGGGNIPFSVAESLKGISYGLQYEVKITEQFELRSSLEVLSLKGDGSFQQNSYVSGGSSNSDSSSFGIRNRWMAKGAVVDLKFLYKWKHGVNFWIGINSMNLEYKISDGNVNFGAGGTNGTNVQDVIQAKFLINDIIGPMFLKETKATSILFGISYAYDFGSK